MIDNTGAEGKEGGPNMAIMGNYCKAFPLKKLRGFEHWSEKKENARKTVGTGDGSEPAAPRTLSDDDYLYLQENYVVTDSIFKDENIIFDQQTSEWVDFCKKILQFDIPPFEPTGVVKTAQGNG